jgi:hypothetical protein
MTNVMAQMDFRASLLGWVRGRSGFGLVHMGGVGDTYCLLVDLRREIALK